MTLAVHLPEGSTFAGEFQVLRLLSAGAVGAVYAVEQQRTGHTRALKVMPPTLSRDARWRARFLQEATVGARIKSDHVVHVVGAGIDEATDVSWIAMELLEGSDLGAVLADRGPLMPEQAREVFAQLCHAVGAAHDAGVVHRDLEPDNIFLAASRREGAPFTVKVLDFGIAKLLAEIGGDGESPTGSLAWTAPDQSGYVGTDPPSSRRVTPRTDVWSLGLLAFTLLTGRSYWRSVSGEDKGVAKLLHEITVAPLVPASERAAKLGVSHLLPTGFDAFFSRCVVRDPTQRFRDAREVRSAFDAVMGARAGVEPTAPMSRRRPSAEVPGPRRILVIDDDPAVLLLLGHHLNRAGYGALTAGTGEEAIETAVRELPTLILLDFMLPDIDGPEVLRRLRANDRTRDIPVILLTATEHAAPIAEAFQAGANDFLLKPVDVRVLAARIEAAITAREKARRATVIAARHERLVADLEEARAEQEEPLSVLPAAWSGFWAVGGVAPSGVVGGDLIALFEGSPGLRTAVVVDVAGHGAGAAMVGASVRSTLGLLLRRHTLVDALAALNEELCSASTPRHACLAAVEMRGTEVTIVNAGLPPVCVARQGSVILEVASSGVPPGLLPEQTYAATTFTARAGDRIAVVSDGLVEPFGHADDALPILHDLRAFDRARWTGHEAPAEVATRLRVAFAPLDGAQPDDATLLLIEAEATR